MSHGFLNERLKTSSKDGHNFELLEFLYYRTKHGYLLRTKTSTDGISTPFFLWCIIPPFGKIWWSGIIHDAAFRDQLEIQDERTGEWRSLTLDEAESNALIFEAMESQGANLFLASIIYINLHWFGWRAFSEDRR